MLKMLMELTFSPSCHNPLGSAIHIKKKKKKSYIKEKADWQEKGNYWDCFWEKRGGGGKELGIAGFHRFSKKGISNSLRSKAASCQLLLLFAEIFNQAIASSNICE